MSGAVLWLTNVIVFGLLYWSLDAGGPRARAKRGRRRPDFWFPQDDNDRLAHTGWHPRLEDYAYVALTNGIAFSPTDAMPLTRRAKTLMGLDALISVGAVLLVAARAVPSSPKPRTAPSRCSRRRTNTRKQGRLRPRSSSRVHSRARTPKPKHCRYSVGRGPS